VRIGRTNGSAVLTIPLERSGCSACGPVQRCKTSLTRQIVSGVARVRKPFLFQGLRRGMASQVDLYLWVVCCIGGLGKPQIAPLGAHRLRLHDNDSDNRCRPGIVNRVRVCQRTIELGCSARVGSLRGGLGTCLFLPLEILPGSRGASIVVYTSIYHSWSVGKRSFWAIFSWRLTGQKSKGGGERGLRTMLRRPEHPAIDGK
jgi:hypothetical protein